MLPQFSIVRLLRVESTQDEAWFRLEKGLAGHGTVIVAQEQTKGRGRQGRVWETSIGLHPSHGSSGMEDLKDPSSISSSSGSFSVVGNLAATLIWRLDPQNVRAGDYSLIVAVAMRRAMADFLDHPEDLKIKWPNDLMLKGRKVAGILLERPVPEWLLIGTGVNITAAPAERACLVDFIYSISAREKISVDLVLSAYLRAFVDVCAVYMQEGFTPIIDEWMLHAFGIGSIMSVHLPDGAFQARFEGLNPDGSCRARLPDGSCRAIYAGDVFFSNN